MAYFEFKTLHVFLVASGFAGLAYLPRIFVNLTLVPAASRVAQPS